MSVLVNDQRHRGRKYPYASVSYCSGHDPDSTNFAQHCQKNCKPQASICRTPKMTTGLSMNEPPTGSKGRFGPSWRKPGQSSCRPECFPQGNKDNDSTTTRFPGRAAFDQVSENGLKTTSRVCIRNTPERKGEKDSVREFACVAEKGQFLEDKDSDYLLSSLVLNWCSWFSYVGSILVNYVHFGPQNFGARAHLMKAKRKKAVAGWISQPSDRIWGPGNAQYLHGDLKKAR
ncbi:hypothetical protein EDD85DRAFT_790882 [Armillaria nabsnona]|nr:hypothetical protein EDD85DRAFT_790882 [Armillaria nabsnona]